LEVTIPVRKGRATPVEFHSETHPRVQRFNNR